MSLGLWEFDPGNIGTYHNGAYWEIVTLTSYSVHIHVGCRADYDANRDRREEECRANAQAIAALPELVEAAKEAVTQIAYLHDKFQETGSGNATIAKLRAALTKAGVDL